MTEMAIYTTLSPGGTRAGFGTAINPHLFRDEAATAPAIHDPARMRCATPLLGHHQLSTTER